MLGLVDQIDWGDAPTWIAAVIAAPSVLIAAKQVRSAARQEEDSLRPVVTVTVEETPEKWQSLDFCVRNVGRGPAYDVEIEFDEMPELSKNIEEWKFWHANFVTDGIPVLSPGHEYRTYVDSATQREPYNPRLKSLGSGRVSYLSVNGKTFTEPFRFDLDLMMNSNRMTVYGIDDQVRSLKRIEDILKKR